MKRGFLYYFLLSLLGYSIYVIMDAIGKKLIGTYHVSQIIFINSIFALLPIAIYVTYKKEWAEVKKYNLKIQIARSSCALIAMMIFFISSNYLPLITFIVLFSYSPLL